MFTHHSKMQTMQHYYLSDLIYLYELCLHSDTNYKCTKLVFMWISKALQIMIFFFFQGKLYTEGNVSDWCPSVVFCIALCLLTLYCVCICVCVRVCARVCLWMYVCVYMKVCTMQLDVDNCQTGTASLL